MFKKQTDEKILSWIQNDKLEDFGKYLISGSIHSKPGIPVAEIGRIEKIIKKSFSEDEQFTLAKKFLARAEYTARNIGTHLLVAGWPKHKKDVETLIKAAANDEEWIVREYAAGTFATLLAKDFLHFSKLYLKWVKTESVNVKRAIALAVKYESKLADPKKWKVYFSLINPLMAEEAEYIRKNLGPFAIGDGLLSRYSKEVLNACKKWSQSKNENVRWNTAMIFTAAAAKKYVKDGKAILKPLKEDSNTFVSKAATKAYKILEKNS